MGLAANCLPAAVVVSQRESARCRRAQKEIERVGRFDGRHHTYRRVIRRVEFGNLVVRARLRAIRLLDRPKHKRYLACAVAHERATLINLAHVDAHVGAAVGAVENDVAPRKERVRPLAESIVPVWPLQMWCKIACMHAESNVPVWPLQMW